MFPLSPGDLEEDFQPREKLSSPYSPLPMSSRTCVVGGGLGSKQDQGVGELSDPSHLGAQPSYRLCPRASARKPRRQARGAAAPRVLLKDHPGASEVGSPSRLLGRAVRVGWMEGTCANVYE